MSIAGLIARPENSTVLTGWESEKFLGCVSYSAIDIAGSPKLTLTNSQHGISHR